MIIMELCNFHNIKNYKAFIFSVIYRSLPTAIISQNSDDLFHYGVVGMLEAKEKFDESKGIEFTTFAYIFIKRHILKGSQAMNLFGRLPEIELPETDSQINFERNKQNKILYRQVFRVIDEMPKQNQMVMRSIYQDGLSFEKTGLKLGHTKSWVSKIHSKTIKNLQKVFC